jgi:hypothetical protein
MKRSLVVASAIALTFASTAAFAGGTTRDHRGDGSPYSSPQGGVRVYTGHRPRPGDADGAKRQARRAISPASRTVPVRISQASVAPDRKRLMTTRFSGIPGLAGARF